MTVNILVAGVGGQGSVLASRILADALLKRSQTDRQWHVRVGETFGAAQRGGSVASHIRAGRVFGPLIGEDQADLVIALEPLEGLRVSVKHLKPGGGVVLNTSPVLPTDAKAGLVDYPQVETIVESIRLLGGGITAINATELALGLGQARVMNVVLLGAAARTGLTGVDRDTLVKAVANRVPPRFRDLNLRAFDLGWEAAGA